MNIFTAATATPANDNRAPSHVTAVEQLATIIAAARAANTSNDHAIEAAKLAEAIKIAGRLGLFDLTAELNDALQQANEKAAAETKPQPAKFETGKIYSGRFITNSDLTYSYKVVRRTAKTV
jgi:pyruvate/2-oxoglutarate dehydrogenase complex dihydrolipoamide acyltransferase (E2) component